MANATGGKLRFYSRPYVQRPGFLPSAVVLVVGWTLVIGCLIVAMVHYSQYSILGYFEFLIALALMAFAGFMTWSVIYEGNLTQELVIDDESITLSTRDKNQHTRITRTLAFKDLVRAEHYKASDTNSVVLRGRTYDLEIPTWFFDHQTDVKLVEVLLDHNIEVLGVPHNMEKELHLHGH